MKVILLCFGVFVLFVATTSTWATELDFSFTTNPNPASGYTGDAVNNDEIYNVGTGNQYGAFIADGSGYDTWLWRASDSSYINPLVAGHSDGGVGYTPNIDIVLESAADALIYDTGFGDLTDVIYMNNGAIGSEVYFLCLNSNDPDFVPQFNSVDLAYSGGATTLAAVTVSSWGTGTVVWQATDVALPDGGHTTIDFGGTPVTGTYGAGLWLSVTTAAGVESKDIGIDNLVFSQIPEPATMALLGLGGFALLRRRRA